MARANLEGVAVGQQFERGGQLHPEQIPRRLHRFLHQIRGARPLQRVLPEPGYRRLLGRPALDLGLSPAGLGDVGDDAVPAAGTV
jgi:hypothetical protein